MPCSSLESYLEPQIYNVGRAQAARARLALLRAQAAQVQRAQFQAQAAVAAAAAAQAQVVQLDAHGQSTQAPQMAQLQALAQAQAQAQGTPQIICAHIPLVRVQGTAPPVLVQSGVLVKTDELGSSPQFVVREGEEWPTLPPEQEAFQDKLWKRKEIRYGEIVRKVYENAGVRGHGRPNTCSLSCRQIYRLRDHFTLDTTRSLSDPDAPGFGWISGIAHRTVSTKSQVPENVHERSWAGRLGAQRARLAKSPDSEPERPRDQSIMYRIQNVNSPDHKGLSITEYSKPSSPGNKGSEETEGTPGPSSRAVKRKTVTSMPTTVTCKRVRLKNGKRGRSKSEK
ncbi:hypothetical protein AOL_s00079g438 [Orbilia oligospora ATCC 24927]|uniref:Uncharacterized protein n=1 Tax=Arthrobotrys oligospora (strain ATCC 24927 / CBS 115.81 / DSM 1491) TaxID=756982 RepID=G1XDQ3_ARTOA|nr:hypothetical protein AOL_s00079g438 [Orbilia oligospora ATCC 24927]EGX48799.1 hypothetical protein AOL_s00079g438 [Orbilia oligospora ATCC 24927]